MARKSTFTDEQKTKIVEESNEGKLEDIAKKHDISVATLSLWRRGGKKSSKKKGAKKKGKRTASLGRIIKNAPQGMVDLSSLAEDVALARQFKALLAQLGYVRRK